MEGISSMTSMLSSKVGPEETDEGSSLAAVGLVGSVADRIIMSNVRSMSFEGWRLTLALFND